MPAPKAFIAILLLLASCFLNDMKGQILPADSLVFFHKKPISPLSTSILLPTSFKSELELTIKPVSLLWHEKKSLRYDSLRTRVTKTELGKRLYDLAVVEASKNNGQPSKGRSLDYFESYSGLHIDNINLIRLNPFGTTIVDPGVESQNRAVRILNKSHIRTRESIIAKYLMFSSGDTVSELSLSETERNLRLLPFIKDARVLVVQKSDTLADIIVITHDRYSKGIEYTFKSPQAGEFELFDRNIAGTGHSFDLGLPYNTREHNKSGVRMLYGVRNIAHSFVDLSLFLKSTGNEKYYGFDIGRDFLSAESEYAGRITLKETFTRFVTDTAVSPHKYTYQDYWLARAFLVSRSSLSRIITGARYINNNVYERPEISSLMYYNLQKYRLYLASLSFSMQKFYKENYIYSYGITEDVPYGLLTSITAGREINEFKTRNYFGTSFSIGTMPGNYGYLNFSFAASSFFNSGHTEQGIVNLSADFISRLFTTGTWKFRAFAGFSFTRGFDRYYDEYLTMGRDDIITGFTNDSIRGRQRSVFNFETVAFSPVTLYGFRFVFFGFTDIAFLGKGADLIAGTASLKGIGAGLRIKNDNLVISTIQLRFTWYPTLPPYSDKHSMKLSGEPTLQLRDFDAGPPGLMVFR